jgi:hypothetical protein
VSIEQQPARGVDFTLPIARLSGGIRFTDGTWRSDPRGVGSIVFSTPDSTTILPIRNDGTFDDLLEPGEYRVAVRLHSSEYSLESVLSGERDLLKEPFIMKDSEPARIEIRVSRLDGQ